MAFETIGSVAAEMLPALTGHEHGKSVSETSLAEVKLWLQGKKPTEVDQALRTSLRSSLNVELQPREELRFPVSGGWRSELVTYSATDPEGNAAAALARIQAAMTPADADRIDEWLVMVQVATAGAKRSETGARLAFVLYAGMLGRYPADVAKACCEHFAMTAKWFPVLAEMVEWCDGAVKPRRMMAHALGGRVA